MRFDFQAMKPVIQKSFDDILAFYPTDLQALADRVPSGGDPYVRKTAILRQAAENCPVHIFPHYPFAFEIDVGTRREFFHQAFGSLCRNKSGVDFSPLHGLRSAMGSCGLGTFNDYTDYLHCTVDHDKLLSCGFSGVYADCMLLNKTETDPEKKRYREFVMEACLCIKRIGERLRERAAELLPQAEDEDAAYNLKRIIASANTPWEKPETMFDALNTLLCTAMYISQLDGYAANALGSVDRLIYPFYERDLAAGRITPAEAEYLLRCFLFKTDGHAHYTEERAAFDSGVTVMIGGHAPDGSVVYNIITEWIIAAYRENRFFNPKLNARASADSPREYLLALSDLILSANNNIIIENDDYIIPMFQRMGLSAEDARCYIGGGCQEVVCRNQLHSRAFTYLNMPRVLLDTLRCACKGEPLSETAQGFYRYGACSGDTFSDLYASFLQNLRSYIRVIAETYMPFEKIHHLICPAPLLSAFTADCIANGKDFSDNGARYNNKTLSLVGFGTLCDSLLSIRSAYEAGTLDTLLSAMESNFSGYEKLRFALQHTELRFGHSAQADAFAHTLAHDLANISRGIRSGQGIEWHTSLFTYYLFQNMGSVTPATPDGRLSGTPLSRQMNMASLPALTDAARSLSRICDAPFDDVGMFDIGLPLGQDAGFRDALTDYIYTCLQYKIPVLQYNTADRNVLIEEKEHKGTHPDLIVRVCGFSALFTTLNENAQDEIIGRLTD